MRKWITFVFVLACIAGLVGCNHTNPSSPPASGSHDHTESLKIDSPEDSSSILPEPIKPDAWTLKEPPKLVVSTMNNADSVTASCGNYQWSRKMPDGTTGITIACGAHPLDEAGEQTTLYTAFPAGTLPPFREGEDMPSFLPEFYLDFGEIPPETVTVRRWPSEYIGRASEFSGDSEEVKVDSSDGFTLFPVGDGTFVYEISAAWGEVGSAYYVFNTLPQVRGDA